MQTNVKHQPLRTHEGGVACRVGNKDQLRRTVMACLLWESGFYESGQAIADRIKRLAADCDPEDVRAIAIEARQKHKLRHAPLFLTRELARRKGLRPGLVSDTLCEVIQRADELAEFLAMYWSEGRQPLSRQVKKGLACAFTKFNEYALAKYNRDHTVKLRDVLFMVHAKPKDDDQAAVWKRLVDGRLATPDTWEVSLSGGADKRETFERLLRESKLGYLALLKNLRNMADSEVDSELVFSVLREGAAKSKALPFRFLAAARAVPRWESVIDECMLSSMGEMERICGKTAVLVDVSGSMNAALSQKSDLTRLDAAKALSILASGICESVRVFRFDDTTEEVPPRRGMALADAIGPSRGGTYLGRSVQHLARVFPDADRIIVVTDEQSADSVPAPHCRGYMINVASNQNGVGYGSWTKIDGFSESVVQYIAEMERNPVADGVG